MIQRAGDSFSQQIQHRSFGCLYSPIAYLKINGFCHELLLSQFLIKHNLAFNQLIGFNSSGISLVSQASWVATSSNHKLQRVCLRTSANDPMRTLKKKPPEGGFSISYLLIVLGDSGRDLRFFSNINLTCGFKLQTNQCRLYGAPAKDCP